MCTARQPAMRGKGAGSNAMGKSLTPLPAPRADAALVKTGMFEYMRHPLYTGLMLFTTGLAALTEDASRALFAGGLIVLLAFKSEFEEQKLLEKFGDEYAAYQKKVKRFGLF